MFGQNDPADDDLMNPKAIHNQFEGHTHRTWWGKNLGAKNEKFWNFGSIILLLGLGTVNMMEN
jgi:hypothetical protein